MAPMETAAGRELRQLAGDARDPGSPAIEPVAVCGNPTIEILATAAERKASMIVLGASHQPAFESIARDRTAYRVLACARCPVLTLHAPLPAAEEDNRETAAAHQ
jgi:nucleotide-binding universal stress UspA family protein